MGTRSAQLFGEQSRSDVGIVQARGNPVNESAAEGHTRRRASCEEDTQTDEEQANEKDVCNSTHAQQSSRSFTQSV